MRFISRSIDRFCQKHRSFGISRLMLFIVLISAGVYILSIGNSRIYEFLLMHPAIVLRGEIWRLITWVFLPAGGNIFFVAISLYFYYFIGSTLEREWGAGKFTIFYFSGVILNVIYAFILWFSTGATVIITPVYLNLSMLFAFATLFPDFTIRLFLVIPIKIKWLAIANGAFFLYEFILQLVAGNIFLAFLPIVAVLNFILICGDELLSYIQPIIRNRTSPQVINFKKTAKQVKREMADKPYRHKCAVCGKTDTDYPELEFRYCSRCNGYHCFCIEHINNHIHFTE
ncbi:MAG: rhomboid family intramembrane serine protease [Oscillospiraceae bacterium]|nr:rhomboid family intramembrane serine protease [Oscillospiraceae bacterium]